MLTGIALLALGLIDTNASIRVRYTNKLATAGGTDAGATATSAANAATQCLGKYASAAGPSDSVLNTLFDDKANTATVVQYRAVSIQNLDADETWNNAAVWLEDSHPSAGATFKLALDTTGITAISSGATIQGLTATNETTNPGLTFVAAASEGAALLIGNLGPNQQRVVWIERTVTSGTGGVSPETPNLRHKGTG